MFPLSGYGWAPWFPSVDQCAVTLPLRLPVGISLSAQE